MKKNKAAQDLANLKWKKTTKKERQEQSKKMHKGRWGEFSTGKV